MCLCVSDGPQLSWWVGGPGRGQVQTYWAGALHGSHQCACGLQQKCVDPKHQCNCDADRSEWFYIFNCILKIQQILSQMDWGFCKSTGFIFFSFIPPLPSRVNDSGLLTHKETLPVRSLVLGDVQRPDSESAYILGHLRCHGDSKSNVTLYNTGVLTCTCCQS